MRKVAVTGGLSSGKSTLCNIWQELGAAVVSADTIVHHLLSPNTQIGQQVIELLGAEVLKGQQIDRALIAKKVFNDIDLLKQLESKLHPAVLEVIEQRYEESLNQTNVHLFVAEVPLFFEAASYLGFKNYFDVIVAVVAPLEICQHRFSQRTGRDKEEFNRRANRQMSMEDKAALADYVINNSGSNQDLKTKACTLYNLLTDSSN